MRGGEGPFSYIDMGGMFTVLKVRDEPERGRPRTGWFTHPAGTVAGPADRGADEGRRHRSVARVTVSKPSSPPAPTVSQSKRLSARKVPRRCVTKSPCSVLPTDPDTPPNSANSALAVPKSALRLPP
jgi:hypothetical protein